MTTGVSCHPRVSAATDSRLPTLLLAGNPNVGKSTVFNRLTGLAALTTNYPGTTVEVAIGTAEIAGRVFRIVDLPGTYGLTGSGEDQRAAWEALLRSRPEGVLVVVDATNLARNLYLVLQLIDLGFPVVVALNLWDAATRGGLRIDIAHLSELLGVPVIATVATQGRGVMEAARHAARAAGRSPTRRHRYSARLEAAVAEVSARSGETGTAAAFLALERPPLAPDTPAADIRARLRAEVGEEVPLYIARQRHEVAERIARLVTVGDAELRGRHAWHLATRPATGLPLLVLVLAAIFAGLFWGGSLLAAALDGVWAAYVSPPVRTAVARLLGTGVPARTLLWGIDAGLNAVLSIGLPYVATFYLVLAVLEDTGYLNAAAVLLDRTLGRMGLNGRAAIPLVAGAGCNVPAIIGLRVLRTDRERLIAGTLITLVPCSARTAVIFGAVARFLGWPWALALYGVTTGVILGAGWGLNRIVPGPRTGLLMEIFPFRVPTARTVVRKTWYRVREFAGVAVPIVLLGSLVLGALYETGWIRLAARPLAPVVEGWLGLPAAAGLTLVFAVLRKELALQLLVALAAAQFGRGADNLLSFMTGRQIFTYALVNTIYIPCVATMAVLGRALGWRRAALISAGTVTLAVALGGLAARALALIL
ncbi:MAG: ferrous iron transport protein B [Armatimonadota bacterium]|nr:ferrous iron transport protein B [Armatimonadota bacterium]MDR7452434.1 ferrous iron transport protein B [Armatimonadota bacterium]MDR7500222.1 ferrous iron transport protein B [Armatimonadota bacterium]MDR7553748.1 ferrous iron transport protein B [Armatimonadota bacterium]MDR7559457.1 ferrous iron transport protein B [Armatimonadota bacterium]